MHSRSVSSCNFGGLSSRDLATLGISHKARSLAVALTSLCSLTHSTRSLCSHKARSLCSLAVALTSPLVCSLTRALTSLDPLTSPHLTSPLVCSLTLRSPRWPHRRTHLTSLPDEPKLRSPPINSAQPRLPRTDAPVGILHRRISPRLSVIHPLRSTYTSPKRCCTPVVGPPRPSRRTRRLLPVASSDGMQQRFWDILFRFSWHIFSAALIL
jgi:hypothetical protein